MTSTLRHSPSMSARLGAVAALAACSLTLMTGCEGASLGDTADAPHYQPSHRSLQGLMVAPIASATATHVDASHVPEHAFDGDDIRCLVCDWMVNREEFKCDLPRWKAGQQG